jgi:hypothetical protein
MGLDLSFAVLVAAAYYPIRKIFDKHQNMHYLVMGHNKLYI